MPFRAFGDSNVFLLPLLPVSLGRLNALPGIRGFQLKVGPDGRIAREEWVLMPFRAFGDSNHGRIMHNNGGNYHEVLMPFRAFGDSN